MHWNVEQVLWALVLAGHLILLIVLLGRDRVSRFPWFTAAIAFSAIHLIADHLLHGKLTTIAFSWMSYSGMILDAVLGILVLIELARKVFASGKAGLILKPRGWMGWSLVIAGLAAAALWAWGPWPAWQALNSDPKELPLLLVLISGLKGRMLLAFLTIETALLVEIFGRRFGFGWRSHPQLITLGLSTNALAFVTVQAITDILRHTVHFKTMAERQQVTERLGHLFTNLDRACFALWVLVLAWWIYWLWRDEPVAPSPVDPASEIASETTPGNVHL